jgi:hypothetical protein
MAVFGGAGSTPKSSSGDPENGKDVLQKFRQKFQAKIESQRQITATRAPICALLTGENSTGKSGSATDFVDYIGLKKDEHVLYIDLDVGNQENLYERHLKDYKSGKIVYVNPLVFSPSHDERRKFRLNYDESMDAIRGWGNFVKEEGLENGIKLVILDGVSKMKSFAELQMKNEKNMDASGDPKRKYWRVRNIDFLEIMELYKTSPIDTVFIGKGDFAKPEQDQQAIDRDTNDLISQKLYLMKNEVGDGEKTEFIVKVLKSRQNLGIVNAEVKFAEVRKKKDGYEYDWNSKILWDLLQPEAKLPQAVKKAEKQEKQKRT